MLRDKAINRTGTRKDTSSIEIKITVNVVLKALLEKVEPYKIKWAMVGENKNYKENPPKILEMENRRAEMKNVSNRVGKERISKHKTKKYST